MDNHTQTPSGFVSIERRPSLMHTLSWRLAVAVLLWIVLLVLSVGYSFILNQRVHDYYTSLSYVSSIRSDIYKANIMTDDRFTSVEFKELTNSVGATIRNLRITIEASDSKHKAEILRLTQEIREQWHSILLRMLSQAREKSAPILIPDIERIMPDLNSLEVLIQSDRNEYTVLARLVQGALILICVIGLIGVMYLLVRWVIRPIDSVSATLEEFTRGNLSIRLNLKGSAEF